jgi:hypothetical protein
MLHTIAARYGSFIAKHIFENVLEKRKESIELLSNVNRETDNYKIYLSRSIANIIYENLEAVATTEVLFSRDADTLLHPHIKKILTPIDIEKCYNGRGDNFLQDSMVVIKIIGITEHLWNLIFKKDKENLKTWSNWEKSLADALRDNLQNLWNHAWTKSGSRNDIHNFFNKYLNLGVSFGRLDIKIQDVYPEQHLDSVIKLYQESYADVCATTWLGHSFADHLRTVASNEEKLELFFPNDKMGNARLFSVISTFLFPTKKLIKRLESMLREREAVEHVPVDKLNAAAAFFFESQVRKALCEKTDLQDENKIINVESYVTKLSERFSDYLIECHEFEKLEEYLLKCKEKTEEVCKEAGFKDELRYFGNSLSLGTLDDKEFVDALYMALSWCANKDLTA